jgi:multidrug efflux pump subunit AcrB
MPLMFETSPQAQFLIPMAITIVFGLMVTTFLVLLLVPAMIGIQADVGALRRRLAQRRSATA